jgi:DNA-binding GntR family transcriptional regulator
LETPSNAADARHLYEQVATALRGAITRGELEPGEAIPSEAELKAHHGVSRDTVRKALGVLTQEGLITAGQGRTRYVRAYAPLRWTLSSFEDRDRPDSTNALDAWGTEVASQGRQLAETVEISIVVPPERVADRLKLDPSRTLVVVRKRVRYVDDKPYQLADSYFPEELVRGTPLIEPRSISVPGGPLATIGCTQSWFVDEIKVRMPTLTENDRLKLAPGTPVAEITRTGYGENDTPLGIMITVASGDLNLFVYKINVR